MNVWKLRKKMTEQGFTQYQLAVLLRIGNNTMSDKMNGRREFKLSEAKRICEILSITDPQEIVKIFFT